MDSSDDKHRLDRFDYVPLSALPAKDCRAFFRRMQTLEYVQSLRRQERYPHYLHVFADGLGGLIARSLRASALTALDYDDKQTVARIAQCNLFWIFSWLVKDIYDRDILRLRSRDSAQAILDNLLWLLLVHDAGMSAREINERLLELHSCRGKDGDYDSRVFHFLAKPLVGDNPWHQMDIVQVYTRHFEQHYMPVIAEMHVLPDDELNRMIVDFYSGRFLYYYPQYRIDAK